MSLLSFISCTCLSAQCLIVVHEKTGADSSVRRVWAVCSDSACFSIGLLTICGHHKTISGYNPATPLWNQDSAEHVWVPRQHACNHPEQNWSVQKKKQRKTMPQWFPCFCQTVAGVGWQSHMGSVNVNSLSPEVKRQRGNLDARCYRKCSCHHFHL